jgi:serine protease DegQ
MLEIMETTTVSSLQSLSNSLADAAELAGRSVVAVHGRQRIPSSGVHWRPGVVVTADHALKRDEEISVTLPDGRTVAATLAGRDPGTDLAVLRLAESGWPTAGFCDAGLLRVGHMVLAVGRSMQGGLMASVGVISSIGGAWRSWRGGQVDRLIRLDLALYAGLSGSPLVTVEGQIAGINTSGLSRTAALTIPASTVGRVTEELLKTGRIARGYLGVGLHPVRLPEHLRSKLNLTGQGGVIVLSVQPGGAADNAGVVIGDIIVALNGSPVSDTDDVQAALGPESVGKSLPLSIIRGASPIGLAVTVGERPWKEE